MTHIVVSRYRGGGKREYEAVIEKLHPSGGLPDGQILHLAGPTEDGWAIVAVWKSAEHFERFRDDLLAPVTKELGDTGFPGSPERFGFDLDTRNEE